MKADILDRYSLSQLRIRLKYERKLKKKISKKDAAATDDVLNLLIFVLLLFCSACCGVLHVLFCILQWNLHLTLIDNTSK